MPFLYCIVRFPNSYHPTMSISKYPFSGVRGTDMSGKTPDTVDDLSDKVEKVHETPVNMVYRVPDGNGGMTTKNVTKTAKNELLYKHGLHALVNGDPDEINVLSREPYAAVSPSKDEDCYVIWFDEMEQVRTPPSMATEVLKAVRDVVVNDDTSTIEELHHRVFDKQVRRSVVNRLLDVMPFAEFVNRGVLEQVGRGWRFYDRLLLTWECEILNEHHDESYEVHGSGVQSSATDNSAFELTSREEGVTELGEFSSDDVGRYEVTFDDGTYTFGKQEFQFVTRAVWIVKNVQPRGAAASSDDQS